MLKVWVAVCLLAVVAAEQPPTSYYAPPDGTDCSVEGVTYPDGASVPGGRCEVCTCNQGSVKCLATPCPMPTCEKDGISYSEGESVPSGDPCTTCTCEITEIICVSADCQVPPGCQLKEIQEKCCDFECDDTVKVCKKDGIEYYEGQDVPSGDLCTTCSCVGGDIICASADCRVPPDCKLKEVQEKCCDIECSGTQMPCSDYDPNCPVIENEQIRAAILVAARENFESGIYGAEEPEE